MVESPPRESLGGFSFLGIAAGGAIRGMTSTYITPADFDASLSAAEASVLANQADASPERRAAVVARVNDEIFGYLGRRQLESVPPALAGHALAMARYRIYRDRATERITQDNTDALAYLKAVANGSVALPFAEPPAPVDGATPDGGVWFVVSDQGAWL